MLRLVTLPGLLPLRDQIDEIDSQVLELLRRRLELVLKVGEIKRANGIKVYDAERERLVLAKLASRAEPPMHPSTARRIFERIIDESRSQEKHHINEES